MWRRRLALILGLGLGATAPACEGELDERGFTRRAESAFIEVHPGWTIIRRQDDETLFVRGDQYDRLDTRVLYVRYRASGLSPSAFFDAWMAEQRAEAEARRRTLQQARDDVIPIIKGGKWVEYQDVGAVGPARVRDRIVPWRQSIANEVFVVLGIPEEKLGYRVVSVEEMRTSTTSAEAWLDRARANLVRKMGSVGGKELSGGKSGDRLLVMDMDNLDGVSGLVLDARFRRRMLRRFDLPELGAAVPIRNVLIIFDPADFVTVKPIRARTHQLYDTQNHPGFRGLLRFDKDIVSVLEPANPKPKRGG